MSCSRLFLEAQGIEVKKNIIMQDNASSVRMEENGKSSCSKRSRHLNIKYFHVTDAVKRKEVEVVCCPTDLMLANFFTKPLQGNLFRKFREVVLGHVHIRSLFQYDVSSSKESVEARKPNLNFPRKNLTNEAKLDDSSSSTYEKMKIPRRIDCKARRSQVNPMLRKPVASRK